MSRISRTVLLAIAAALILFLVFVGGVLLGYADRPEVAQITDLINKGQPAQTSQVDFEPFWKTWQLLDDKFVNANATSTASTTDKQVRVWGAISGLVDSLGDPYTTFFPPAENKSFNEEISGNFGGVGMELGARDGALVVIAPLKGTPADQAGILAGDKIVAIDGKPVGNLTVNDAISLIRGEIGTKVVIKIARGTKSEERTFNLVRAAIEVPTVEAKLLPNQVFLISVYNFGATSPNLFREALRQFIQARTDKLIIDLRGNPGGYLDAAVDMASWFLPSGQVIVTEDHGNGQMPIEYRSKGYNVFTDKLKLIIMVDGGSASASEIFAGALQEHNRALLVGEKTFGKGSVQELVPITKDTSLKVTIARWLTPNGTSISHNGLTPDVTITQKPAAAGSPDDKQLLKAEELIQNLKL